MLWAVLSKVLTTAGFLYEVQPLSMAKTALRVELVSYASTEAKQPSPCSFIVDLPSHISETRVEYTLKIPNLLFQNLRITSPVAINSIMLYYTNVFIQLEI